MAMIENFREFLNDGYQIAGDAWWLWTEEGAQKQVRDQMVAVENELVRVASPARKKVTISPEVTKTIEKMFNVIDFTVKFSYVATKACWYFTAFNVVCHISTRLFSWISLTYFVSSVFFGVLSSDLSKLESHTKSIRRQFYLIQGPEEHLSEKEEISLHIRDQARKVDLTKVHIQGAIFHVEELQESLYILKYPLMIPFERVSEHLKAIETSLHLIRKD